MSRLYVIIRTISFVRNYIILYYYIILAIFIVSKFEPMHLTQNLENAPTQALTQLNTIISQITISASHIKARLKSSCIMKNMK